MKILKIQSFTNHKAFLIHLLLRVHIINQMILILLSNLKLIQKLIHTNR
jgi:hypothetical protein